jgi:thioredoxin-related protein
MRRGRVRARLLPWQLICLLLAGHAAYGGESSVPLAADLAADARLAASTGRPLMLLFTREECGYCALLKRSVIVPMIISGEYEDRVIIRELVIDRGPDLLDFGGQRVSPFAVADRYEAFFAPVVLLVGPDGEELHERLIGISNEEMYLFYLDQAIDRSTAVLRTPVPD